MEEVRRDDGKEIKRIWIEEEAIEEWSEKLRGEVER